MTTSTNLRIVGAAAFTAALSLASAAEAACTPVTALPVTLTTGGNYCLTHNLWVNISTGAAITVSADDVVIDLNGWMIESVAAPAVTRAAAIRHNNFTSLKIKNGTISGFYYGVFGVGKQIVVSDVTFRNIVGIGAYLYGESGAVVERNRFLDFGGPAYYANNNAKGVESGTPGAVVANNIVSNLLATGSGSDVGLQVEKGVVRDNVITDAAVPAGGSYGVIVRDGVVAGNTVMNFGTCVRSLGESTVEQNVVGRCDLSYSSVP